MVSLFEDAGILLGNYHTSGAVRQPDAAGGTLVSLDLGRIV